jgi:hypothetical protein
MSEESFERMKHIHFVVYRLKSIIIIYLLLFFSDRSLPLSRLITPNPHKGFKSKKKDKRWNLILKEGILNEILEVFVILNYECFYLCLFKGR